MKFKTDDAVWYDDNIGIVVCGYPVSRPSGKSGINYDIWWPTTGTQTFDVWESDLISPGDYIAYISELRALSSNSRLK